MATNETLYRPVLDWPNAEGWWHVAYANTDKHEMVYEMVYFRKGQSHYNGASHHGWRAGSKSEWEAIYGPSRFIKAEPNPFPTTPNTQRAEMSDIAKLRIRLMDLYIHLLLNGTAEGAYIANSAIEAIDSLQSKLDAARPPQEVRPR